MNAIRTTLVVTVLVSLATTSFAAEAPQLKIVQAKPTDAATVEVVGIAPATLTAITEAKLTDSEWPKVARLVVDSGTEAEVKAKPPVAGVWSVAGNALRFEPQFPLAPGLKYRVLCDFREIPRAKVKGDTFALTLQIPKPAPGPRVSVVGVFPSANRLPENTLRFYIQFSGPVARGDVYKRVKLVRDDGVQVAFPFLEIDEELWAADGTRLTLLFDPGRVKRGLKPREEDGPILEEGRSYTFTIDSDWRDLDDRPLVAGHTKKFSVFAPDDQPIWPEDWRMTPPRPNSDTPLMVRLAKPLDHALLGRMLWVVDSKGIRVEGTVSVGGGERVVSFTPKTPWANGDYKLVIDARLEDVCGNRVGEPFELDVLKPIPARPVTKITERAFTVK
jgi:hypothetical protein